MGFEPDYERIAYDLKGGPKVEPIMVEVKPLMVDFSKGVGDVSSEEKGSGARFNAGKPPMELIPVWIMAEAIGNRRHPQAVVSEKIEANLVMRALGSWQRGVGPASEILGVFDDSIWVDCARVFEYGKRKYAEWNWAKGMMWSIPTACAVRHLLAIESGEHNDPESGLPHRGHVACNIVMLAQYELTFKKGDDRPLKWIGHDVG